MSTAMSHLVTESTQIDDLQKLGLDELYQFLNTSPNGLTTADAVSHLDKKGRNELEEKVLSDLHVNESCMP